MKYTFVLILMGSIAIKAAPIESDDYNNNNKNLPLKDVPYGIDFPSSANYDPAFYENWNKVNQSYLYRTAAVQQKESESPKIDKKSLKIPTSN